MHLKSRHLRIIRPEKTHCLENISVPGHIHRSVRPLDLERRELRRREEDEEEKHSLSQV